MLVLTRKLNESICIDDAIEVVVVELRGKRVRLGFRAPNSVSIKRKESVAGSKNGSHRELQVAVGPPASISDAAK